MSGANAARRGAGIAATILSVFAAHVLCAQSVTTSADSVPRGLMPSMEAQQVIDRVRGLAGGGRGADARLLLDSLVAASANASLNAAGSTDANLAEALFWRAALSEQAADAERDWKRLVLDVPLSARAPAALLKLGDSETTRGRSSAARVYYERLLRDYGAAPERWRATIGISRSYFDDRDVAHACATLSATRLGEVPDGELRLQAQALHTRCANERGKLAAVSAPVAPSVAPPVTASNARKDVGNSKAVAPASSSAAERASRGAERVADAPAEKSVEKSVGKSSGIRYSVQVAAYDTKAQADAVVKKLAKRGFKARVDGTRKPFRVRVGSYATHGEADAALARMKKAGQKGFIAETTP